MSKNNLDVDNKYINADFYNYENVKTMSLDLFESDYITAKLTKSDISFVRKNYSVPIFTKAGRLIVKTISPATAGNYEIYIKSEYVSDFDNIPLRPKLVHYLKYSGEGYKAVTPKQLIEYNINWMTERGLEVKKENADTWQFQLDTFTFLT